MAMSSNNSNPYAVPRGNTTSRYAGVGYLVLTVLVITLIVTSAYLVLRPAMPRHQLRQLKSGMTKREVQSILGKPTWKGPNDWQYERFANLGWVEVHFDEDSQLTYVNDESAFP